MPSPDPRALITDALLSAQQLGTIQKQTLERLEAARTALFDVPYLSGHRDPPNEKHALSYEATAAMLRRRAARQAGDDQTVTQQRAEWYARRAEVKRAGALMPRELRTPGERLSFVNSLRHALLLVWEAADQIDPQDVTAFVAYLVDGDGAPLHGEQTDAAASAARLELGALVQRLPELLEQLGLGTAADGERGFFACNQPLTFDEPTEPKTEP